MYLISHCVRDWSGILCEARTSDFGVRTTDFRFFLSEEKIKSEQRYSGKPDGEAGTPKESVECRV